MRPLSSAPPRLLNNACSVSASSAAGRFVPTARERYRSRFRGYLNLRSQPTFGKHFEDKFSFGRIARIDGARSDGSKGVCRSTYQVTENGRRRSGLFDSWLATNSLWTTKFAAIRVAAMPRKARRAALARLASGCQEVWRVTTNRGGASRI
jgi:hypothetical protein